MTLLIFFLCNDFTIGEGQVSSSSFLANGGKFHLRDHVKGKLEETIFGPYALDHFT